MNGFTLLHLLLSMSLMGAAMLSLAQMLTGTSRFERGIASNSDLSQLINTIRLVLEEESSCAKSGLIGTVVNPSNPSASVLTLTMPDQITQLASAQSLFGSRQVKRVHFSSFTPLSGEDYFATLRLEADPVRHAVALRKPTHDFHLKVKLDAGNRITSCSSGFAVSNCTPITVSAPLHASPDQASSCNGEAPYVHWWGRVTCPAGTTLVTGGANCQVYDPNSSGGGGGILLTLSPDPRRPLSDYVVNCCGQRPFNRPPTAVNIRGNGPPDTGSCTASNQSGCAVTSVNFVHAICRPDKCSASSATAASPTVHWEGFSRRYSDSQTWLPGAITTGGSVEYTFAPLQSGHSTGNAFSNGLSTSANGSDSLAAPGLQSLCYLYRCSSGRSAISGSCRVDYGNVGANLRFSYATDDGHGWNCCWDNVVKYGAAPEPVLFSIGALCSSQAVPLPAELEN